jgi:hypothetical protein
MADLRIHTFRGSTRTAGMIPVVQMTDLSRNDVRLKWYR